ncbi:MAG: hypothetical protein ACKVQW_05305 [Pyrinomonadaceae bacterium]
MNEEIQTTDLTAVETEDDQVNVELSFARFLEEFPTNSGQVVSGFFEISERYCIRNNPQLKLWCGGEHCNGYRRFDGSWQPTKYIKPGEVCRDFLVYVCRDCGIEKKTYCLLSRIKDEHGNGEILKVGEFPELHIEVPNYLPKLLGEEWPYFVKGLKCEKQGFGIAAMSYYRRVVENQKGRMFESMAVAAEKLQLTSEVVETLRAASSERNFETAISMVKDHIPESFKVNGHNPMRILYSTLSKHLHEESDEESLSIAHDIRIVLQDMSQRIKDALRDDAEARASLTNLMKARSAR